MLCLAPSSYAAEISNNSQSDATEPEYFTPENNGIPGNSNANDLTTRSFSPCEFRSRVDNPHISSTSSKRAIQAHGWWDLLTCQSGGWRANVKVGLMVNLGNQHWVDAGTKGQAIAILPGGGKGRRATAHVDCKANVRHQYKAWVDVDIINAVDPPTLYWSDPIILSC